MILSYPLQISIAGNFDTSVRDSAGREVMHSTIDYLRSMDYLVYTDRSRASQLYRIKVYPLHQGFVRWDFLDASGRLVGAGRRAPLRDLLQRNFEILTNEAPEYRIRRGRYRRPMPDSLLSRIPVLGTMISRWPRNAYLAERLLGSGDVGQVVMRMGSLSALSGGKYEIVKLDAGLSREDEERLLLGFLTASTWAVNRPDG